MVLLLPKSMATRLRVAIVASALLPTMIIGWIAFGYLFDSVRQSKIDKVGMMASLRHDQLTSHLWQAKSKAELFLAQQPGLCDYTSGTPNRNQLACLEKALTAFVHAEEALGGKLTFANQDSAVTVGAPMMPDHTTLRLPAGQLVLFPPDSNQAARVFHLPVHNDQHQVQLVLTFPASSLQGIFAPPSVLGQSGETFLADPQGYFITAPRYHSTQGHTEPISAVPMQTCLRGVDAEMLELDYRAAPIIHGFHAVPEIGGGCIMAHIEQQEAFMPLARLKEVVALLALLVTVLAGLVAYFLAKQLSAPLTRLRKSTEEIQHGMQRVSLSSTAPSEIRELQDSFLHMMERLDLSTQELQASNQKLSGLIDTAMDAIVSVDEQQKITLFNHAAEQFFGYQAKDILGQPLDLLMPQRFHSIQRQDVDVSGHTGIAKRIMDGLPEVGYGLRANGEEFPFEASVSRIEVAGRRIDTAILRDISARRQAENALQLAASVYQQSQEGIIVSDENNLIIDINPAFTRLTGYTLEDVRGKNPRVLQSGKHEPAFYQAMWQSIQNDGRWEGEVWDLDKNGALHVKWLNISVLRQPDGGIYRYVGQFTDITEKKRQHETIWRQANYDALTNLPNRRLLADRINQAMASSERSGCFGGLISLDMDNFKVLNDTAGHPAGDQLLKEVAKRLGSIMREEDTLARLGGDEFMLVLSDLSSEPQEAAFQAKKIAEKVLVELCRPYRLDNLEHYCSASLGIVMIHGHSEGLDDLLAHVDAAMYQAKADGRNTISFFDSSMQAALKARTRLESALRSALSQQELQLFYQLQVDRAGRPIGAEALLRWIRPGLGMVSPVQFIPIAEDSGLILPIGRWVLETACAQLACWQADPELSELTLAVNVSARQFRENDFVAQVRDVVAKSGIWPAGLELELTESMVLVNVEDCIKKMQALKALGIRLSMDDFGTGYSSLSYLSRLPMNQLKIDQSFVRDITTDQHDAVIVQTIISMAHSLGLEVIAEGVETETQREFLDQRGCHAYQGYLFAKPAPIGDIPAMLEQLNKPQTED